MLFYHTFYKLVNFRIYGALCDWCNMTRNEKINLFTEMYHVTKRLQIAFTQNKNLYSTYLDEKDGIIAIMITKGKVIELLKEEMEYFKNKSFNEVTKLLNEYHSIYINILEGLPDCDVNVFTLKEGGLENYFKGGVS